MLRWLFFFPLFCCFPLLSQERWQSYFEVLQDYNTRDEIKLNISNELSEALERQLRICPDMDIAPTVPLHKVATENKDLFIYTWHYTFQDATSYYGGVMVRHHAIIPLSFTMAAIDTEEVYSAVRWGGGLYYEVIPQVCEGDTVYTLLAWDGNNGVSYKKIIEILSFDPKGNPVFGKSLFASSNRKEKRVIFEYSAEMSLLLSYDQDAKSIVTNALHSNDPRFADVQAYRSATDAFNVFRYENNLWVLYKNVDLRMNKQESKRLMSTETEASSGLLSN